MEPRDDNGTVTPPADTGGVPSAEPVVAARPVPGPPRPGPSPAVPDASAPPQPGPPQPGPPQPGPLQSVAGRPGASSPSVAAALEDLAAVSGRPLVEHPDAFARVHAGLQRALADIDDA